MKKHLLLLLTIALLFSCKNKKSTLTGGDTVEVQDFIKSFPLLKVPYQLTDAALNKKNEDSTAISYEIFTQFVPDTLLSKEFGEDAEPKIYPLGRIDVSKDEKYLLAKAIEGDKKVAYIISLDGNDRFAGGMEFLRVDSDPSTTQVSTIDRHFSIDKAIVRKKADGSTSDGKDVYGYNKDARQFMLFMTDPLDETVNELINPLDTLPRKNKFSGDYIKDKKNIVSIRDGKKPDRFRFFIHFEKMAGDCSGELKGDARFTSAGTAIYQSAGDPCVMQFSFTANSVTLKEQEGCGSRRGLKCSFDGSYPKKKEQKPKTLKKKIPEKK
jgi:hypothetical protein